MTVHAVPTNDIVMHELGDTCVCGPTKRIVDETNQILPAGPFYKHHALSKEHVRWRTIQVRSVP